MKNVEKAIRKCSKLQDKALDELGELSCRVTMLNAALSDAQDHPLWAGMLTAVADIQKSVKEAHELVDEIGLALPSESDPELKAARQ